MTCPVLASCARLGTAIHRAHGSRRPPRGTDPLPSTRRGLLFETIASLWIIRASAPLFFTLPLP